MILPKAKERNCLWFLHFSHFKPNTCGTYIHHKPCCTDVVTETFHSVAQTKVKSEKDQMFNNLL